MRRSLSCLEDCGEVWRVDPDRIEREKDSLSVHTSPDDAVVQTVGALDSDRTRLPGWAVCRAAWQSRQFASFCEVRPALVDNGYCGDWLAGLFANGSGALWYALRRSKKAAFGGEVTLRAWHTLHALIESASASLDDTFQIEKTRAR